MNRDYKLKELLVIKNGRDHQHIVDGEIPIYGSGGVMRFGNMAIYDKASVLLPRKGSLTNIQYVDSPFWTVDTIYYSAIDEAKVNPYYLYRYLKLLDLSGLNSGTGVPSMTFDAYYEITVNLPSIKEQQKIAKVLSDLDKKIELNNKIIKELEAMSKELYDYWFVQFDFPDTNGKPYRSSGGAMIYDPIIKQEIPQGWEVKPIKELIKEEVGGDWGGDEPKGNLTLKVACVRGADINSLNGKTNTEIPIRYINKNNTDKILSVGDIILEISGGSPSQSTGRIAAISEAAISRFVDPLICTNFCKAVTLNDKTFMYNFLYEWERAYNAGIFFNFEGKTSGIKNFLYDSFVSSFKIPFPPKTLCEKFRNIITDIDHKKHKSLQQNQELTALRDWLLPMLMNGQITIK